MPQVTVTINGRSYRMACDAGEEERLTALAGRFDASINSLRGGFGEIGDQRLTVMAGIMMTDQLAEAERKLAGLTAEVETLREARAAIVERAEATESEVARRIEAVAERLETLAHDLTQSARDATA